MKKLLFTGAIIFAFGAVSFGQTTTTETTTTKTTKPKTATATTVTATTTTKTTTQTALTPEQKSVRAAFDKLVAGVEKADVDAVTSVYQNSPSTLYFNNNGSITRGWEQDRKNKEQIYLKVSNIKLTTSNVRIEMLGANAALLTCQWTQAQDSNGKPETASGRMTLVFKKIGNAWKAIHLHTSPDRPDATRPVFPSERDGE